MIRTGVIGLGSMGRNHVRLYNELSDSALIGISDINERQGRKYAELYKTEFFPDFKKLLEKVEAISIVVPTHLHEEVALAAIERGVHILVEKPLAHSFESGQRIVESAKQKNITLMVGHVERFNPLVKTLKRHLEKEEIILIDITRVGPFPPRVKDVGVIIDMSIHDIDLIRFLTAKEPVTIRALHSKSVSVFEDTAVLSFELEDGVLAHITTNWITPFKVREIQVATKENYYVGNLLTQRLARYSRYALDGSYLVQEIAVPHGEPLRIELAEFLSSIKEGKTPSVSGEDGLKNLLIAEKCIAAGLKV